jgi:hypothetical protein
LFGFTSTRTLTRNVRATFKLKKPTKLSEITQDPNFSYQKFLDDGSVEEIRGRFLGFGAIQAAELCEVVKVQVKTGFGIESSGILKWMKL